MQLINHGLTKFVLGAVTLLVVTSVYAKPASASRYAVAFTGAIEKCNSTPGAPCAHT